MNAPTQLYILFHNKIYFLFVHHSIIVENGIELKQFYFIFIFILFRKKKMEFYVFSGQNHLYFTYFLDLKM